MQSIVGLIKFSLPFLFKGLLTTIEVSIAGMFLGLLLGMLLVLLRLTNIKIVKAFVNLYVSFVRGTPFLIQIFIVFYSLTKIGINLSNTLTGIIAVGLNCAAFMSEVIRGGLNGISEGHIEAAEALGMSNWTILWRIRFKQVFLIIRPQMISEFINAVKCTPILSAIGVIEIARAAARIVIVKLHPVAIYIMVILMFFFINSVLEEIEKRLRRKSAKMEEYK